MHKLCFGLASAMFCNQDPSLNALRKACALYGRVCLAFVSPAVSGCCEPATISLVGLFTDTNLCQAVLGHSPLGKVR